MASWEFKQIGGDKKVLRLDGYAAPFGRARKGPVATETIKLNIQTTKYPGSKGPPTRHSFGSGWEPMELHGRWMTKNLTGKTANEYADDWSTFVRDEQLIQMSWGNIASYQAIIEQLTLERESQDEIAWKMVVLIDYREQIIELFEVPTSPSFVDTTSVLAKFNKKFSLALLELPGLNLDFFEQLDFMLGNLKALTGKIDDLASVFDNIEKATASTIQNVRGILTNVQAGIAHLNQVILNAQLDYAVAVRHAESDIAWIKYQLDFDSDSLGVLAFLASLERSLVLFLREELSKTITAQNGDTWEKLATRAGLGPDRSGTLREWNGIRFGQQPVPGVKYLVPVLVL